MESIKINKLEIENVKRVKAVTITPTANGLTIIGGDNNQGKTSVLDAIAWGLGGNRFKPSNEKREGSVIPPTLKVILSNGLVVERKGKNSDLKVTDPQGEKAGQTLLDSFVEEFALNLPKFMESNNADKARILLKVIGVGDKLIELENQEKKLYNERLTVGQIADRKKKFADEQPYYTDAPKELVSAAELIKKQQAILAKNGENQRKRQNLKSLEDDRARLINQENDLVSKLADVRSKLESNLEDIEIAKKSVSDLIDESTAELEKNLEEIETINAKVRKNLDKEKAEDDAKEYTAEYNNLTGQIEKVRQEKIDLLNKADLPLQGLTVSEGELLYNNQKWDCMSGSERLMVATAIVRKLKPQCGFVLLDKLEQMDQYTLREFGDWLEKQGMQAIATKVSRGDECSIIIQDGYVLGEEVKSEPKAWTKGEF